MFLFSNFSLNQLSGKFFSGVLKLLLKSLRFADPSGYLVGRCSFLFICHTSDKVM